MASEVPFAFVQFEFGFTLGPADGRYLARPVAGADPSRVIVLRTLGAPRRLMLRGRRARRVDRVEAEPVPTTRATIVRAQPFGSRAEADEWLSELRSRSDGLAQEAGGAMQDLNRVMRTHRAVAADPYSPELAPDRALTIRVGYGSGDQVADGRFAAAYELPRRPARERRVERLSPQEHLAAILGGREELLACEELVLRARADIDADRPREAALQARVALECVLAELEGDGAPDALRELAADREVVSQAGNAALRGDPPEALQAGVTASVKRMEQAIRRHRLRGGGRGAPG